MEVKTHGGLIGPGEAARLAELGVSEVQISYYSPNPEVHDYITRRPGSHEATLGAIKLLLDHGVPVKAAYCAMGPNLGELDAMRAHCTDLGVELGINAHLTDAIGRTWQVGTIQGDRVLPDRLDASYIGEDGEKHRPVMLHRAIFGSYERFIGILIEHFAGRLPVWLAPTQAVVATIVSDADDYAKEAVGKLEAAGIRVDSDLRNEKINYKVREHSLAKVPHLLVVGKREAEEGTVAVRTLGEKDQRVMSLEEAIDMLRTEATPPDLR